MYIDNLCTKICGFSFKKYFFLLNCNKTINNIAFSELSLWYIYKLAHLNYSFFSFYFDSIAL